MSKSSSKFLNILLLALANGAQVMELGYLRRLPTLDCEGKTWTVDYRLREFRFVVYGKMPEFVPFESDEGIKLLREFLRGT